MSDKYLIYLRREEGGGLTSQALAQAAGIARADADRILKSKIPQCVYRCDSRDQVRDRILHLREAGLESVAVTNSALRKFDPITVVRGERSDGGIYWEPKGSEGVTLFLGRADVRMMVVGKFHTRKERTIRTGSGSPLLSYAILGAPMTTRQVHESRQVTRDDESFFCLFQSRTDALLVRETEFDFRGSLAERPLTREGAFQAVLRMAREAYPDATFDDVLYRHPASVRMVQTSFRTEACTLLSVESLTKSGSSEERTMMLAYLKYLLAFGGA